MMMKLFFAFFILAAHSGVYAQDQNDNSNQQRPKIMDVLRSACDGKNDGDACEFQIRTKTRSGHCKAMKDFTFCQMDKLKQSSNNSAAQTEPQP